MFVIHVLDVVIIVQCGNIGNRRTPLRAAHIKGAWCGADFKGLRRMTDKNGLAASSDMIWNHCFGDKADLDEANDVVSVHRRMNCGSSG
jgi:hypothetical protein